MTFALRIASEYSIAQREPLRRMASASLDMEALRGALRKRQESRAAMVAYSIAGAVLGVSLFAGAIAAGFI